VTLSYRRGHSWPERPYHRRRATLDSVAEDINCPTLSDFALQTGEELLALGAIEAEDELLYGLGLGGLQEEVVHSPIHRGVAQVVTLVAAHLTRAVGVGELSRTALPSGKRPSCPVSAATIRLSSTFSLFSVDMVHAR